MEKNIIKINIISVVILCLAIICLFAICPIIVYAEEIENDITVEFNENSSGFSLSCRNITDDNRCELEKTIEDTLKFKYNILDTNRYLDCVKENIDLSTVEECFTVNMTNYSVVDDSLTIATRASSKDVSIVNTVTRDSESDEKEYKAYECSAKCIWSKAPINRFKDIFAIAIQSDTTPLYRGVSGMMRCEYNVHGQGVNYVLGISDKLQEYSISNAVGVKYDLPIDVVIGGLIYLRMEFEVSTTVLTKSDFNMFSGYAHRILIGSPTISTDGVGFTVNNGTDLFTGQVVSQII